MARSRRGRPPEPEAAHRRLAGIFRGKIAAGEWPAGFTPPAYRRLAREHGVGAQVARLALQTLRAEGRLRKTPRGRLAVGPQQEILSALQSAVALLTAWPLDLLSANPDLCALRRGLEEALTRTGDPLLIVHSPQKRLRAAPPPDLFDLPLSGILLAGPFRETALRACENARVPVVLLDRPPENRRLSAAWVNNEAAARDATTRLLRLGHRRIAFVRRVSLGLSAVDSDSRERQEGFLRALREAGLPRPADAVFNVFSNERAVPAALRLMADARPPFTAVLAADEGLAEMTMAEYRRRGLRAPRDFSLAVFHRAGCERPWSGPATDFCVLGRLAVHTLYAALRAGRICRERLDAVWEDGGTIGPPPGASARCPSPSNS